MKRPIFIIAGTVLVFILLGVWVYILIFGAPEGGTFADFNFGNTTDETVVFNDTDQEPEETAIVNVQDTQRLKQLTTRPVIGYQHVQKDASSTPYMYYAESGTGHVYTINLESGKETRISSKTVPLSRKAAITPDGAFVMVQSHSGPGRQTVVTSIGTGTQSSITLNENIVDFAATDNDTFLYSVKTGNSVVAKHYYPISDSSETLFTVPFREATIIWGDTASDVHYAYPHPTGQLEGFAYKFQGGVMSRTPIDGYGLSTYGNESFIIYSKQVEAEYTSFGYNQNTNQTASMPFTVLPEKCVTSSFADNYFICAAADTEFGINSPDDWYKGAVSYNDNVWQINAERGNATLILNPQQEVGRELDMLHLKMLGAESFIYFVNKTDQTLWMFDQNAN